MNWVVRELEESSAFYDEGFSEIDFSFSQWKGFSSGRRKLPLLDFDKSIRKIFFVFASCFFMNIGVEVLGCVEVFSFGLVVLWCVPLDTGVGNNPFYVLQTSFSSSIAFQVLIHPR